MEARHLDSIHNLTTDDLNSILSLSIAMKRFPLRYRSALRGMTLAMVFQKPSTRTRVSFQVGINQLGGLGMVLGAKDLQLGRGETVEDTARVLSRYVDGIMARVFDHDDIVKLSQYATVPVINGLSDLLHPCQAICDYFTIIEKFAGGPVGVGTLAAAISEESDAIEDIYEPYLLQIGFLDRTPRGRVATRLAYEHFGKQPPSTGPGQRKLFG